MEPQKLRQVKVFCAKCQPMAKSAREQWEKKEKEYEDRIVALQNSVTQLSPFYHHFRLEKELIEAGKMS